MNHIKRLCPPLPSVYGHDDAHGLVQAYRNGQTDPLDVATKCVEAAEKNPKIFLTVSRERALMEAEASRQRYRVGRPLGPLDGVPVGWKDLIEVAGTPTTAGSVLYADSPPKTRDAPVALLCARAGLVCVGKVSTTEFAYSGVGINQHFGTPPNAYSTDEPLIPGGSSAGSGAAVGAGLLPVAVGTDTGGSIRVPSALNGVTGFKPTTGRYNREGLRFLSRTQDTQGPMARSVRDVMALDAAMRGSPEFPDLEDIPALEDLCFVADESFLADPQIEDDVKASYKAAVMRIERAGAVVRRKVFQPFHDALDLIAGGAVTSPEIFSELKPILDDEALASRIDQRVRKRAELLRAFRPERVVLAYRRRAELIEEARKSLGMAVLLTPTVGHTAPPVSVLDNDEEVFFKYIRTNTRLTGPGSLMNMPIINLPIGLDAKGLPIGLSLCMAAGLDDTLLRYALAAEGAFTCE